ncbi:C-GCAxxG-C-C family protein [Chloroflexota bacterium]
MITDKGRIIKAKIKAHDNERDYSGCSQSVLGAIQDELGIGNQESFKAATVLSGGVACQGETCGAIIGALSALGLVIGRNRIEDTKAYSAMKRPAIELRARFMEEVKKTFELSEDLENTLCRHIQEKIYGRSFDLTNEEGVKAFLDAGGHSEFGCPKVCGIAAEVAAERISELIK